jgi:hypothetical protein
MPDMRKMEVLRLYEAMMGITEDRLSAGGQRTQASKKPPLTAGPPVYNFLRLVKASGESGFVESGAPRQLESTRLQIMLPVDVLEPTLV